MFMWIWCVFPHHRAKLSFGSVPLRRHHQIEGFNHFCRQKRKTHKISHVKKQLRFLRYLQFKSFLQKQTEETKIYREIREPR